MKYITITHSLLILWMLPFLFSCQTNIMSEDSSGKLESVDTNPAEKLHPSVVSVMWDDLTKVREAYENELKLREGNTNSNRILIRRLIDLWHSTLRPPSYSLKYIYGENDNLDVVIQEIHAYEKAISEINKSTYIKNAYDSIGYIDDKNVGGIAVSVLSRVVVQKGYWMEQNKYDFSVSQSVRNRSLIYYARWYGLGEEAVYVTSRGKFLYKPNKPIVFPDDLNLKPYLD